MARKYAKHSIEELEQIVKENLRHRPVLAAVLEELGFRRRPRAVQLRREVKGFLDGEVPAPPKPPRRDRPDDQGKLFGD